MFVARTQQIINLSGLTHAMYKSRIEQCGITLYTCQQNNVLQSNNESSHHDEVMSVSASHLVQCSTHVFTKYRTLPEFRGPQIKSAEFI